MRQWPRNLQWGNGYWEIFDDIYIYIYIFLSIWNFIYVWFQSFVNYIRSNFNLKLFYQYNFLHDFIDILKLFSSAEGFFFFRINGREVLKVLIEINLILLEAPTWWCLLSCSILEKVTKFYISYQNPSLGLRVEITLEDITYWTYFQLHI